MPDVHQEQELATEPNEAREHLRESLRATQVIVRSWLHKWNDLESYHLHAAGGRYHKGDPASKVDGIAVRQLHDEMIARFGDAIHFVGEESLTTAAPAPGHYVLQDDAVDGTQPAKALGIGYATTGVLFLHLGNSIFQRVAAGVATEQAVVTWVEQPGRKGGRLYVLDPALGSAGETRVDAIYEGQSDIVAVVAAKPVHRRDARLLLDPDSSFNETVARERGTQLDSGLTVFNLGGSPMLFPLLSTELGAVISFRHQTPWDALDTLAIEAEDLPATIVTADGPVQRTEAIQWFDMSMNGSNSPETVPPHATVTHPDLVNDMVELLRTA